MEMKDLEDLIKGRRSVRQWKKDTVPDDLLEKAIELATWAPNGGNFQGWRFVVVKNRGLLDKMGSAVQAVADKVASWPEARAWPDDMTRQKTSASRFKNAPVCIGVFISKYESFMDKVLAARDPSDQDAKQIAAFRKSAPTAIQSAAAAVTTLLLVLHSMGLGAVWMVAPLVAKKDLEALLKTPAGMDLVCLVAVGYPDESPRKDRRPVKEVMEIIG